MSKKLSAGQAKHLKINRFVEIYFTVNFGRLIITIFDVSIQTERTRPDSLSKILIILGFSLPPTSTITTPAPLPPL
jgi:hypothetical protein